MNRKKFIVISSLIIAFVYNLPLIINARHPLEIIGLNQFADDSDIKERCHALLHKYQGVDKKIIMQIKAACNDLDRGGKDDCKINYKKIGDQCNCPDKTQTTCVKGFTNHATTRCDCPLSDGSKQSDVQNQFNGSPILDECYYEGQPCTRLQSNQKGACKRLESYALFCNPYVSCENNPANNGKECVCESTKNKGTCGLDSNTGSYKCQCSNDECENNTANEGKTCTCPNGNKGTCQNDFDKGLHKCQCSHDECENNKANLGKSCRCPSGKKGTCKFGDMEGFSSGYRCECEEKKSTRSSKNTTKQSSQEQTESQRSEAPKTELEVTKYYDPAVLYSINITAPIYDLPLQHIMQPTSDCEHWWLSVAPFMKRNTLSKISTDQKLGTFDIRNTESGLMFNIGYYDWWYVHTLFSLAASTTKMHNGFQQSQNTDHSKFGILDTLIGCGFKTDQENWKLGGEYFIGESVQRVKNGAVKYATEVPSFGTGLQANFDCTVYEKGQTRYELSTLSRFTYFVPISIKYSDIEDHHELGTVHYTPGGFVDLFIGLKQYYDFNGQFIIDVGYNPTFHVMDQTAEMSKFDLDSKIDTFTETIPSTLHTVYAIYGYAWNTAKMPMNISLGGSVTFALHENAYGTFFATFSCGF